MKKIAPLVALSVLLFSVLSHADESFPAPSPVGRDEALRTCDSISVPTHRRQCREEAAKGVYFEDAASRACGTLEVSYRVTECIVAIRDRRYSEQEVRSCWRETFDHERIGCIQGLGTPVAPHFETLQRLREAVRAIDAYDLGRARAILRQLIDSLGGQVEGGV